MTQQMDLIDAWALGIQIAGQIFIAMALAVMWLAVGYVLIDKFCTADAKKKQIIYGTSFFFFVWITLTWMIILVVQQ